MVICYKWFIQLQLGDKESGRNVQDFTTLREYCLENGMFFEDPEFPPTDSSLKFSSRMDRHVEWLRPHEISDNPQFFVEG